MNIIPATLETPAFGGVLPVAPCLRFGTESDPVQPWVDSDNDQVCVTHAHSAGHHEGTSRREHSGARSLELP